LVEVSQDIKVFTVINKIDLKKDPDSDQQILDTDKESYPRMFFVSAATGEGTEGLLFETAKVS
jgi:50S ribosomal subunit-associated GTPase HflX